MGDYEGGDMTPRQMRRAARSLETWAAIMRSSEIIRVTDHPRKDQFDNDPQGKADEREYLGMIEDAKALRALAKRTP